MAKNMKKTAFTAALGLSIALIALPVLASESENSNKGDCPMDGSQMRQGKGMEQDKEFRKSRGNGMRNGERRYMTRGMGGHHMIERFSIIDQNDDGRISDDEAAVQRELVFVAMDADDDQELTLEEFMEVSMEKGDRCNAERFEKRQQAKRARFAPMDTDESGKVSIAEWMTEGQQRFASADADDDGVVTPWEFRSRHR